VVTDSVRAETDQPPAVRRAGYAGLRERNESCDTADVGGTPSGGRDGGDYWTDTATDPGGYHGEIELTPVGAVPVAELEG